LDGGERQPTPEIGLRLILTKNDKRKTTKSVSPLRL